MPLQSLVPSMTAFVAMLVYTSASGACIVAGGLLARIERIHPQWLTTDLRHSVIAFGGGILVAAVAFVLVPEGDAYFESPTGSVLVFVSGGVVFMYLERVLAAKRHDVSQTLAMLLDYVPESLALGGMFALEAPTAPLLALLVGLQNLPEGFNAYRELNSTARSRSSQTLIIMLLLIPLGPAFGTVGWFIAAKYAPVIGATMLFAAGGVLYLIFQDIAPQSRREKHWGPALGAVLGFALAMLGQVIVGGR